LEGFNVLGALGELSDGLDEGNAGLLVGLEWGEDGGIEKKLDLGCDTRTVTAGDMAHSPQRPPTTQIWEI